MMVDFSKYLKVRVDPNMPSDQVNIEQNGKVVGAIINLDPNSKDFSPPGCDSPINPVRVSSEAHDGEKPLTEAALKANLYYAEALKQKTSNEYVKALLAYHEALSALNHAICERNNNA